MTGISPRRLTADVAVQVVGRVLNVLASVPVTVLLIRHLGESHFGQWSTLVTITLLTGLLGELRLEQAAVKEAARGDRQLDELLGALVIARLIFAVPATLASVAIALVVADSTSMAVAGAVLSMVTIVYALGAGRAVFQVRVRNDITVLLTTVNTVAWTAVVIVVSSTSAGLVAFAVGYVGSVALMVAVQALLVRRFARPNIRDGSRAWRSLAVVGAPLGLAMFLVSSYARIDQVIVFLISGERAASLYRAVYRVLDQARVVPLALVTTLFPAIVRAAQARSSRLDVLIQLTVDFMAFISIPPLVVSIVMPEQTVVFLFGDEFAPSAPALAPLLAAFVVTSYSLAASYIVVAFDGQGRYARFAAAGLIFNVTANLIMVPQFGFVAAAWITLATEALVFVLLARAIHRQVPLRVNVARVLRIIAAGFLTAAALAVCGAANVSYPLCLCIAGVVYCASLSLLRAFTRNDLRTLLAAR
jgi:O-antigen/teichoic acid export membrane protein